MLFCSSIISTSTSYIQSNEITENPSNNWHFIPLGDIHQELGYWDDLTQSYSTDNTSSSTRRELFNSIIENNPNLEFIIHTGDIVKSGGEQNDWNRYYEDIENVTKNNVSIYYAQLQRLRQMKKTHLSFLYIIIGMVIIIYLRRKK
ncbi:MAG: hypothetical protein ACFFAE_08975 [Candidatus Hodarchaeota archaeon]